MRFLKHIDDKEKSKFNKFRKVARELHEVLNTQKNKYIIKRNIFHASFKK